MSGTKTLSELFWVMRDPSLSLEEKVLWALYRSYDSGHGAWPGDELLAQHLGRSPRSVQRYRKKLIQRGLLLQQRRGQLPAVCRAVVPGGKPYSGPPNRSLWREFFGAYAPANQTVDLPPKATADSPPLSPEYAKYGSTPITAVSVDTETGAPRQNGNGFSRRANEEDEWS